MKRKTRSSIALALSLLASLVSLPATAQGQQQLRFRADTGFVTLGPAQVLRITVNRDTNQDGNVLVGFSSFDYVQTNCTAGTCKHAPVNPNPVAERYDVIIDFGVISKDISQKPGSSGVRGIVFSNSRDVRVTATISNTVTGETASHIMLEWTSDRD